jgi:eukaryotic-like serine/threonine-protein kinase
MPLSAGTRLGPYEVVAPLGAGGMGEVFKARDTRLDRSVAIKVLPAEFAQNAQLKTRFEREAKTISQLNHPHICTLYDVGDGYLVMELLEGETLADRIAKGPLPIDQVLRYGVQIAEALDKAHKAGVVHRDLKPGNVMITKSGAKLLDFGLAKSTPAIDLNAETQHKALTAEGTLLGTFQYMAPEQLEGAAADARTDIFAFGVVLYEMATGKRAFEGKTKTSLIAAIVSGEPEPLSQVRPLTPPALEHVVRKCLAKDPEDRWQSAHDIAEEVRWISEAGSQAGVAAPVTARRRTRERAAWAAAVIAAAAIAAYLGLRMRRPEPSITASISAPLHAPFDFFGQAAVSPDGNSIAFVGFSKAGSALWVRPLDREEPRMLPATEGALSPFWSPDGKALGFFSEGKLKRVPVGGGPSEVICEAAGPAPGGAWNKAGVILFSAAGYGPIYRVSAAGGKPEAATKLEAYAEADRWPYFLPDDEHFIFLGDTGRTETHQIKVGSLRDSSRRDVIHGVTNAIVAGGQLLFVRGGSLLAQAFDSGKLAVSGEPRVIAEHVTQNWDDHRYEFSASANGRLVYRSASPDSQLAWVDRTGKQIGTVGEPRRMGMFSISPDLRHVAIDSYDADGRGDDIWLYDERGVKSRLTFDPASDFGAVWSPDSSKVAFGSLRDGNGDAYLTEIANPASVVRLTSGPSTDGLNPVSWSPDGRYLLLDNARTANVDIYVYDFTLKQTRPYVATPFNEQLATFSPDGSWVAFESDQSGRDEVYVERFPSHAERRQISIGGGRGAAWSHDGRELFYVAPDLTLMAADLKSKEATPKPLFHLPGFTYKVSRDGRFLVDQRVDDLTRIPLTLVLNWKRGAQ